MAFRRIYHKFPGKDEGELSPASVAEPLPFHRPPLPLVRKKLKEAFQLAPDVDLAVEETFDDSGKESQEEMVNPDLVPDPVTFHYKGVERM